MNMASFILFAIFIILKALTYTYKILLKPINLMAKSKQKETRFIIRQTSLKILEFQANLFLVGSDQYAKFCV